MLSTLSTTSSVDCSARGALDREDGLFEIVERRDGVLRHELAPDGVEHRASGAMGLDGDERRAADLARADHPTCEFGGGARSCLRRPGLGSRRSARCRCAGSRCKREQFPAAADEPGLRLDGQRAEARRELGLQILLRLPRRTVRKSCGSSLS
jgi:hypothetical protein